MRRMSIASVVAALALAAMPANAQFYQQTDPYQDHLWQPDNSSFASGSVGVPSPIMGSAGAASGNSGTSGRATPAPQEQKGTWVGTLDCGNLPVCGYASASRGWGFATWVQHWTCQGGTTCGAYPGGYATDNVVCQTSAGNLGYVFGQQCYLGAATS